jgi:gas vesicle protein
MNTSKVLLGVLAGVAAGAAIGILMAPDRGEETRKKIMKKSSDYAADLKDKFNTWCESSLQQFESVKEDAMAMAKKAKTKVDDIKTS